MDELDKAIKYWYKMTEDIIQTPLAENTWEDKMQLARWLEELKEYKAHRSYVVLQYDLNEGIDVAAAHLNMINEALKDSKLDIIAIPNNYSLTQLDREELIEIWQKMGENLGVIEDDEGDYK